MGSLTRLLRDAKRPGFDWGFSGEVGTRPEWYECACCPPNVIRLVASLGHYFATANTRLSAPAIQIHQYGSLEMQLDLPGGSAFLRMQTNYPWDGGILIDIQRVPVGLTWSLELRRPGWAPGHTLSVNGAPIECEPDECGYLRLGRDWQPGDRVELSLPLGPYLVESHPRVDATRGCPPSSSAHWSTALKRATSPPASTCWTWPSTCTARCVPAGTPTSWAAC